ncbi:FIST signal transduction protein [Methanocaldococcus indicus]|uniref:FIST signal transduction protein n=1 Tax=Methanocaldococcus indicus TaxID=213231 RepID=UPI003C6D4BD0
MLKVGIGHAETGKEAGQQAMEGLQKPKLSIVFFSSNLNPNEVYDEVREVIPTGYIIGCSTAGELSNLEGYKENSVAVLTLESPMLKVGVGIGTNLSENPIKAGETACISAYKDITSDPTLASFLFLGYLKSKNLNYMNINPFHSIIIPDGLAGVEESCMRGIVQKMGRNINIVGGSSGDDLKFKRTYQICNGVYTNSVVFSILCGFKMGTGMTHPYIPTDKGFIVTKSKNRCVYELDGQPASEVLKDTLKVKNLTPQVFADNPLGVRACDVFGEYTIKSIMMENPDKSLTFYSEVPENIYLNLMTTNKKIAEERFKKALENTISSVCKKEDVACIIVFNCILRYLLNKELGIDDIKLIREVVGDDVPVIGFNTYGEQGATRGGSLGHYNQTATILVISKNPLSK